MIFNAERERERVWTEEGRAWTYLEGSEKQCRNVSVF